MQIAEFITDNRVNICFDTQYELCLSFTPVDLNCLYNNIHNKKTFIILPPNNRAPRCLPHRIPNMQLPIFLQLP